MTNADLNKIINHLAAIGAVLASSHGGRADDESLLEFRRACWSALLLADDGECQALIDLLVQRAKELYSDCERPRVEILRGEVARLLDAFRARLAGLGGGYGKRWRDLRAA
jgi:hypothetical protein